MLYIRLSEDDFQKVENLLPDVFPNLKITLETRDENLVNLGFCNSAPCVVGLDVDEDAFEKMLDTLVAIETDAFNNIGGENTTQNDELYQKYLKYGGLYSILYNADIL